MATSTSIAAYHELRKTAELSRQERTVLNEINRLGFANITAIAKGLGMEKSTVSARMNAIKNRVSFVYDGVKCRLVLDRVAPCPISYKKTEWYKIVKI